MSGAWQGSSDERELLELARNAVRIARTKGAMQAAAGAAKGREVEVQWRDGALEKITEATSRSIGLQLYVDGRYSSLGTSDLRPHALEAFIEEAIALTRTLAPDPFRSLPEPRYYEGIEAIDLEQEDASYRAVTAEQRLREAQELEQLCRQEKPFGRAPEILSITSSVSDSQSVGARVHSNGFEGTRRSTSFWSSASVTLKDPDGRRPEEYGYGGSHFLAEKPAPAVIARQAMERAAGRIGAKKPQSVVLPLVLENRSAGRLLGSFLSAANAASLQQKRSMFEGRLDTQVASPLLGLVDDPFIKKGFGSRLWDGDGIAAKRLPILEGGVLRNVYVDWYYGRKLGMEPNASSMSNFTWAQGSKGEAEILREVKDAIFVTGFLGGNSNGTTGDFSFGVQGFRVRGGERAESVSELNISGNHLEVWKRLIAVGNDPYPYSAARTPTLAIDAVQFAGAA